MQCPLDFAYSYHPTTTMFLLLRREMPVQTLSSQWSILRLNQWMSVRSHQWRPVTMCVNKKETEKNTLWWWLRWWRNRHYSMKPDAVFHLSFSVKWERKLTPPCPSLLRGKLHACHHTTPPTGVVCVPPSWTCLPLWQFQEEHCRLSIHTSVYLTSTFFQCVRKDETIFSFCGENDVILSHSLSYTPPPVMCAHAMQPSWLLILMLLLIFLSFIYD